MEVSRWGLCILKYRPTAPKAQKRLIILAGSLPFPKELMAKRRRYCQEAMPSMKQGWGEAQDPGQSPALLPIPCQRCIQNKFPSITFPYRSDLILTGAQIPLVTGD